MGSLDKTTRMIICVEWTDEGPAVVAIRYNPETKRNDGERRVLSRDPRDVILASIEDRLYMIEQSIDAVENGLGRLESDR